MTTTLRRAGDQAQRVTTLELFFDLVFVFAITQTSHLLLEHLSWEGAGQTALVLLVVWWSWNFTTWAMNELDPESAPVRLLLLVLMLLGLLMAVAIPEAWGDRALLFVGCYVAVQLLRHGFLAFSAARPGTVERDRAARIFTWFVLAGAFWIAGGIAEGGTRTALWLVALLIDYGGPLALYWLPGRGRSPAGAWDVGASHFAERFQLFVIIALGETIILTGATASSHELDLVSTLAVVLAFVSTATLWWLYFGSIALLTETHLHGAEEQRTTVARDIFTYLHVVLIGGIVASAVGDEVILAHPKDELETAALIAAVAGPVLYLLAQDLMRLRNTGRLSPSRTIAIGACLLIGLAGTAIPAFAVGVLLVMTLLSVAGYDTWRRRHRPGPTMRAALAADR
jgi:low temperature requirement protein LtrA